MNKKYISISTRDKHKTGMCFKQTTNSRTVAITNLDGETKILENVSWDNLLEKIETEYGLTIDYYDLYIMGTHTHITRSLKILRNTEPQTELMMVKSDIPIRITDDNVIRKTRKRWDIDQLTELFGPIGRWDVSFVKDMEEAFDSSSTFNQPIGDWDVSSVHTMERM